MRSGLVVLAVLVGIPAIEIAGFVFVGARIGAGWTILLTFATAAAGIMLMRSQGLAVLGRIRNDLAHDRVPAEAIGHGAMIVLGGVLLLIPGFVTDILGLLLLLPPVRTLLWRGFTRHVTIVTTRGGRGSTAPGVVDLDASAYHHVDGKPLPRTPWSGPGDAGR